MRFDVATLILLVASAGPAAAQRNAELMANDHYTRSHDYDLVDQRISVRDFDWDSTSFAGSVTTTLVALQPGLDSVILDAGAKLRVTTVTDRAGRTLRSATHGDTLVIYFPRPLAFRDTARFTITYHGRVENGRGLTFIQNEGRVHRPQQIWSQGEDDNNHDWFPTYDFPNDKMTWALEATVPRRLHGRVQRTPGRRSPQRRRYPHHDLAAGQAERHLPRLAHRGAAREDPRHLGHGSRSTTTSIARTAARARPLFHVTPDMIAVYSRLTGVRYPWAKYAQTTVADFFGGMENVSATTLVDWLPDARAYADRPWYQ